MCLARSWHVFGGAVLLAAALALAGCGGSAGKAGAAAPPSPTTARVFMVIEENKSFADVIGSPDMPFLNSLAQQNASAANYFANAQTSLPNYTLLTAGQEVSDDSFAGVLSGDNVVRALTAAGKTWKVYAESLPAPGYLGPSQPPYVKWHNPFVYLSDVVNNPAQAANVVPISQLAADIAANHLPDYGFIVPDNTNNSHDCPLGMATCTLAQNLKNSDGWLNRHIGPLLNNGSFQAGGVLIITYDESVDGDAQNGGGQVPFIVVGSRVKRGYVSNTFYQHASALRLALGMLGVSDYPGAAANAPEMSEFLQ